ncbi:MAG: M1 family metallopeptidase [Anaerolineales bacterium]
MSTRKSLTVLRSFALLVILALAACQTAVPTSTSEPHQEGPHIFDTAWGERELFRANLVRSEQGILDELPGATEYRIEFTIADDFNLIRGHEAVLFTNQEATSLDAVYFRLYPNVTGGRSTISNVTVDGVEVETRLEEGDSSLRVQLPELLEPNASVVVDLGFEVEIPREMGEYYGLFGYFNDVLVLDTFYPMIPVYDDEGWNAAVPQINGDLTYNDAAFYLVQVHSPADLVVVASGVRLQRVVAGDTQTTTFANGPARDFYIAASERFTVISEKVGETTINSYAFPEWGEGSQVVLQSSANALRSFNSRFGTYPYREMDLMSTPMLALGIEYPGAMGIALRLYDPSEVFGGLPSRVYLESVVAHEIAHQWFYSMVGNDQPDEPWIDEALAQYATGLYYQDTYDSSAAESYRSSWQARWDGVNGSGIPIGLSAGEYEGSEYSAIVYGRGPIFIAELANAMGINVFDDFIKTYVQEYKWDIGTGEAFKRLAEEKCDCDLTSLFNDWVYP